MTRLANAARLELTLQVRQRFLHAAIFSGLIWLAVLLPMPAHLRPVAEPYIIFGDIAIIGFFFIAGTVFFEKQERTLLYLIPTHGPLLLAGTAFGQITLTPWQVLYAVGYPVLCAAGLWWTANAAVGRYVVARSGGM